MENINDFAKKILVAETIHYVKFLKKLIKENENVTIDQVLNLMIEIRPDENYIDFLKDRLNSNEEY